MANGRVVLPARVVTPPVVTVASLADVLKLRPDMAVAQGPARQNGMAPVPNAFTAGLSAVCGRVPKLSALP